MFSFRFYQSKSWCGLLCFQLTRLPEPWNVTGKATWRRRGDRRRRLLIERERRRESRHIRWLIWERQIQDLPPKARKKIEHYTANETEEDRRWNRRRQKMTQRMTQKRTYDNKEEDRRWHRRRQKLTQKRTEDDTEEDRRWHRIGQKMTQKRTQRRMQWRAHKRTLTKAKTWNRKKRKHVELEEPCYS